jgi:DNA-binding response OmpR family regulator
LLTARDDMETRAAGMNLGVSDFLAKPVNTGELFRRVRIQLESRQHEHQLDLARQRAETIS